MTIKIIAYLKSKDPVLGKAAGKIKLVPLQAVTFDLYFPNLTRHIIYQQLSGYAAAAILRRFEKLFPKGKIAPKYLLKIDAQKLRSIGISKQKIVYLKDLANRFATDDLVLKNLNNLESEQVIEELTKIKGIGRWTVEMFLMNSLGREDIFSAGDLGLKNAIKKLYKLDSVTKEELEEISLVWSPYRSYACKILWGSLKA